MRYITIMNCFLAVSALASDEVGNMPASTQQKQAIAPKGQYDIDGSILRPRSPIPGRLYHSSSSAPSQGSTTATNSGHSARQDTINGHSTPAISGSQGSPWQQVSRDLSPRGRLNRTRSDSQRGASPARSSGQDAVRTTYPSRIVTPSARPDTHGPTANSIPSSSSMRFHFVRPNARPIPQTGILPSNGNPAQRPLAGLSGASREQASHQEEQYSNQNMFRSDSSSTSGFGLQ